MSLTPVSGGHSLFDDELVYLELRLTAFHRILRQLLRCPDDDR